MTAAAYSSFVLRTRFTWLAYFCVAYYSYMISALGPLMPFLRDELGLNYTMGGYHLSAFAVAMIGVGLLGDAPARLLGRQRNLWIGCLGMTAGAALLVAAQHPALTISGALVMGAFGSIMLSTVQAALVDQHGERSAIPITESNIAASLSSSMAPLLIGGFAALGVGWRGGLVAMIAACLLMVLVARSTPVPPLRRTSRAQAGRLPLTFWGYWLVIVFGVSVEGSIIFIPCCVTVDFVTS